MSSSIQTRFANAVHRIRRVKSKLQYAEIGPYRLRLAADSQIPNYRKAFHLYDTALGRIAGVLRSKYPALHAIDIGANVGDTSALIRQTGEIPVLCVEGDPTILPILAENVTRLGPGVVVEPSFVGKDGDAVSLDLADEVGSNASLVKAIDSRGSVRLRSLRAILGDHPLFKSAKLLKIDTEGFDFDIIRESIDFIERSKPAVFFEYDPHFRPDKPCAGLETIETLIHIGYSDFIYYDNFGNFLLHSDATNRLIFSDLNSYLASNRKYGVAVYYFDICALHREDTALVPEIRSCTQVFSGS